MMGLESWNFLSTIFGCDLFMVSMLGFFLVEGVKLVNFRILGGTMGVFWRRDAKELYQEDVMFVALSQRTVSLFVA